MDKDIDTKVLTVLEEIREGQKQQLAKQGEALELQRTNFELVKKQFERANRIQARAEKIQNSASQLVAAARKSIFVIIPIIVLLLSFFGWIIFRMV